MVNGSSLVVIYLMLVHKIITAGYNHMLKQVYSHIYLSLIPISHLKGKVTTENNLWKRDTGWSW